ncbi:hypothetical protein BDM02DRAFT_3193868 [Thelephora ganbajun]|uniref:Uncharacterized protein n=1 Tax=Thelephora ganbajun TaxID=370292 RepID=A0ACB6YXY7_THEGA|nr:hypothetical protein BDM02DRAFT_3193868 [Thelephora ganbajun]
MTPPNRTFGRLEIRLKSGSTIARAVRESPSARSQKSLVPNLPKVSHRRLRQTKSYMLPRKKSKSGTDNISRSCSVGTNLSVEEDYVVSLSPGGSPKRDRELAKALANPFLEFSPVPRSPAQVRLEILLVKEAKQRSGDGIHPRVDRQLLGSDRTFGHYETLRRLIVQHILTVQPPPFLHRGRGDLYDQLSTSSDTRFAAAYLMTRFWFLCEVGDHALEWKGFVDYGWQLAIACIALCVKMQRDFLPPLYPITNKELITLAPRGMTVYDLEQAQRDILEATSYSLQGNTPQPFLEELRCSLSTLQQLDAINTLGDLTKRFWARMFDALLQRDVLFTPISMLAACVLVAISPAERATVLQEEHEFGQVSVWFEGVEKAFA